MIVRSLIVAALAVAMAFAVAAGPGTTGPKPVESKPTSTIPPYPPAKPTTPQPMPPGVPGTTKVEGQTSSGLQKVIAIDGDDLSINGVRYRLVGIDAFELDQTCKDRSEKPVQCGKLAQEALSKLLDYSVSCTPLKKDGDRQIARCSKGDVDLQEAMVRKGWAFVRPDFAGDQTKVLCAMEEQARTKMQGAWDLSFEFPYFHKNGATKTAKQVTCTNSKEYRRVEPVMRSLPVERDTIVE